MKLVKPSIKFLNMTPDPLLAIERAGRTCYKSEEKISKGSAERFVKMLLDRDHHAMIEHAAASYKAITCRGVTHEIVRHRLFSFAQESTRWCNYSKDGVTFLIPPWVDLPATTEGKKGFLDDENRYQGWTPPLVKNELRWVRHMIACEEAYLGAIKDGWIAQKARGLLPIDVKTEIVITGNMREWRHFFKLRTHKDSHPQMQEVANMVLKDIQSRIPILFDEFDENNK